MYKKLLLAALAVLAPRLSYADPAGAPVSDKQEAVRACDAFGQGYFYIPGTNTCLKVHGYVRTDMQAGDQMYVRKYGDMRRHSWDDIARITTRISTATQTELGVLRSFVQFRHDWEAGGGSKWDWREHNGNGDGTDNPTIRYGYFQLGGLRIGLDETIFATWPGFYGNVINDDANNPMSETTRVIDASYTWTGKNGLSAIIGAEQSSNTDAIDDYDDAHNVMTDGQFTGQDYLRGMPGHIIHGNRNTERWAFRFTKNGVKYHEVSQQSKNYNLYYIAGVKYTKDWGDLIGIAGYDPYWGSIGAKARIDVNLSKKWSAFLMGGYKSVDDYYYVDGTYSMGDKGTDGYRMHKGKPVVGLQRATQSLYGDWGGHWSLWWGATYQYNDSTSFNFQSDYTTDKTYYTTVNITKEVVPGLVVIPEVSFFYWDNNYGCKKCMTITDSDEKVDARLAMKDKTATQFMLRMQRNF